MKKKKITLYIQVKRVHMLTLKIYQIIQEKYMLFLIIIFHILMKVIIQQKDLKNIVN